MSLPDGLDASRFAEFQTVFQTHKCQHESLETARALTYDDGKQYGRDLMMSNADKPKVVTTRWWWVRHAPVRSDGGNIYGQQDIECDTGDTEVFEAVAKMLPRDGIQTKFQTSEALETMCGVTYSETGHY